MTGPPSGWRGLGSDLRAGPPLCSPEIPMVGAPKGACLTIGQISSRRPPSSGEDPKPPRVCLPIRKEMFEMPPWLDLNPTRRTAVRQGTFYLRRDFKQLGLTFLLSPSEHNQEKPGISFLKGVEMWFRKLLEPSTVSLPGSGAEGQVGRGR